MEADQFFSLQWSQHKGTIVSTFEKLFERNALVDCTLAAEGQYLNVHKVILTACSPYFEVLLSQNHDKHPIIILKDVTFRELKAIVDYMYRGTANVSSSGMKDFLAAAASLQIKGLGNTNEELKKGDDEKMEFMGSSSSLPGCTVVSRPAVRSKLRSSPPMLNTNVSQNASLFDSDFVSESRSAPHESLQDFQREETVDFEETWLKNEALDESTPSPSLPQPPSPQAPPVGEMCAVEPGRSPLPGTAKSAVALPAAQSPIPSTSTSHLETEVNTKFEPPTALENADAASVSSIIELSDTSDECGDLEMDEEASPGGLWHASQNTIAYESESFSQQEGASDLTQHSMGSGDQDTENLQQGESGTVLQMGDGHLQMMCFSALCSNYLGTILISLICYLCCVTSFTRAHFLFFFL